LRKFHVKYTNNTGMLDILFCMLFLFFIITVLQASVMKIESSKKNVESSAEFLITVMWPEDLPDDVDVYLEDPAGNIIFYGQKAKGLMHLDRDDLGYSNDIVIMPDGTKIEIKDNIEVVTIRGIVPGEYTLNIHMFHKNILDQITPVKVKIEKLNPYTIVLMKEIELEFEGQEETVCRFVLSKDGGVTDMNNLKKQFVKNNQGL